MKMNVEKNMIKENFNEQNMVSLPLLTGIYTGVSLS